ncbi:MAG TPA: hypothetical protein PKA64_21480 [Myxococcota bacterium]|nr:hypothetical protein [Myxococcota bacterium]
MDDAWTVHDADLPLLSARYAPARCRMITFGLADGGLCVVTPGSDTPEAQHAELARWGSPRFLLAPNHFHNMGLKSWSERYPDATIVAHPRAIPRLRRRGLAVEDLTRLEAALPPGARLFGPPGARQGETWVSLPTATGTAWFVTDAILNERRLPPGPLGWFMYALGFRARLMTNPFFKRLFLPDRAAYKAWVAAELERDAPTLFLPAHGTALEGEDLAARLREVTEAA